MTICLSIVNKGRIIGFCDSLTELNRKKVNRKKFVYPPEAHLLLLPSGDFEDLNLEGFKSKNYDGKFLKRNSILENSKVICRLLSVVIDNSNWELQSCGFEELSPFLYKITKKNVFGPHEYQYSGPKAIHDFFNKNVESLKNLPSDDNEKIKHLRQLVIEAIAYENQVNEKDPKTGGEAIYEIILSSDSFHESRYSLS